MPKILRESPLGWMLEHWEDCSARWGKSKEKMIYYCVDVWGNMEIGKYQHWPTFGTFETKLCQAFSNHLYEEGGLDNEELDYAKLWEYARAQLFPVKTSGRKVSLSKTWELLENLLPPYQIPPPQAQLPLQLLQWLPQLWLHHHLTHIHQLWRCRTHWDSLNSFPSHSTWTLTTTRSTVGAIHLLPPVEPGIKQGGKTRRIVRMKGTDPICTP